MSPAAAQPYWLNTHGPLVHSHADTLKIRRYVQSHTIDNPATQQVLAASRGAPEGFDGVAELWWDSPEDMAAGIATPEGRDASRALLEDERRFVDHARSPLWISAEHPIVEG